MIAIVPKTARPTRQVRPTIAPVAVADRRDAVQRALDAGAIVVAEMTDAPFNVGEVVAGDVIAGDGKLVFMESRFRHASEIHARSQSTHHVTDLAGGV